MSDTLTPPSGSLLARWEALKAAEPRTRQREAALKLGVSEAELVAALVGPQAVRLHPDWQGLFAGLPGLGAVMALTRNEHAVIEKVGAYAGASFHGGHVGTVLGAIDLRIFLKHWHVGFALVEKGPHGERRSLQFFDRQGVAVHKVFQKEETDTAAFDALIAKFAAPEQDAPLALASAEPPAPGRADAEIDAATLRGDWAALQDTHDFIDLLKKHGAERTQALHLAGPEWAMRVEDLAHRRLAQSASESGLPIMVFVGNKGMIEIHTGPVKRLVQLESWFNVLDPGFNLHLDESGIAETWLVRKPTKDGIVTSVEQFDAAGGIIAQYFGERKPGRPELPEWRALAESLK